MGMDLQTAVAIIQEKSKRLALQNQNVRRNELARDNLLDFITYLKSSYIVNWHHRAICERLSQLKNEQGKRIAIFLAPQRGKSELVSRFLPAWWLGNFPGAKIILSSYSGDLANSFNRDCQDIIGHENYSDIFPDTITGHRQELYPLKKLKLTQNEMHTSKRGYLFSVGVGGSTTGRAAGSMGGGDPGLFILDDPIKDLKDALSSTQKESKMGWWRSVVNTRVHGTSHIILMHTRWAKDDIAGQVLAEDTDNRWEVLSFPEIGPDPDYPNQFDSRTIDEPLWPEEKGDYAALMKIKEDVGGYVFSALYMQKPKVVGGAIIKDDWIRYYTKLPFESEKLKSSALIQSWDLQFKETGTSFTVGLTLAKHNADFYLVDFYRKKADIIESMDAITSMSERWPNCNNILIEEKANGNAILDLLKKKISGMIPIKPEASKDERLHLVAPFFEAGNVYLPMNHPKIKIIVEELTSFPSSINDDIVDAFSMGLSRFTKLKGLRYLRAYK